MRNGIIWVTLLAGMSLHAQAPGPTRNPRAEQVKKLNADLWISGNEDLPRFTDDYVNDHLSQLRAAVQAQVLETLTRTDKPEEVRQSLQALFKGVNPTPGSAEPMVYSAALRGLTVMVVGYDWAYGGKGVPSSRLFLDGYRKSGSGFEVVAETGGPVPGSLLLEQLESPRPNESWYLARVHAYGISNADSVSIYSFDGYEFKLVWSYPQYLWPEYEIAKDSLTITHSGCTTCSDRYRETIRFTISGPVLTTERLN